MWPYVLGGSAVLLLAVAALAGGASESAARRPLGPKSPGPRPTGNPLPPRRLPGATTPLPTLGTPTLTSSPYGYRVHPVDGAWRLHQGVDIPAPQGTPVMAPVDGIVAYAKPWDGESHGGTVLAFDGTGEAQGMRFKFMHLSAIPVPVGTVVAKGGLLALTGNTGKWTTGPHLHMEVEDKASGREYDPVTVFPEGTFRGRSAPAAAGIGDLAGDLAGDLWEPAGDPEGLLDALDDDVIAEAEEIQAIYNLKPEEALAIADAAQGVGGTALALARVIYAESRMNPKAVNAASGAVGLIQWLPSSAKKLGTTPEKILRMSFVQQVALAERYLLAVASGTWAGGTPGLLDTQFKLGAAVFYPAWRNKDPNTVLPANVRAANPGIRTMGDYMDRALDASARREARYRATQDDALAEAEASPERAGAVRPRSDVTGAAGDPPLLSPGDPTLGGTVAKALFSIPELRAFVQERARAAPQLARGLTPAQDVVLGTALVGAHAVVAAFGATNPQVREGALSVIGRLNGRPIPVPGVPWLKVRASLDKRNPGGGVTVDVLRLGRHQEART